MARSNWVTRGGRDKGAVCLARAAAVRTRAGAGLELGAAEWGGAGEEAVSRSQSYVEGARQALRLPPRETAAPAALHGRTQTGSPLGLALLFLPCLPP